MFIPCSTTHPSSIHPKEYIVHTDKILNLNKVFQHISHIIHVTAGGTTHYQNNFVIPFSCLMPPPPPPHFLILLYQFHDILATAYIVWFLYTVLLKIKFVQAL